MPLAPSGVMGSKDARGEQVRLRLTESDSARIGAIQDYYERQGVRPLLQVVVSDAIACYYKDLATKGLVVPEL